MSELGVDLAGAREALEAVMSDQCLITRVPELEREVNEQTGLLIDKTKAVTVYEGRCMFRQDRDQGYLLSVPASAARAVEGDLVKVTASRHDPSHVYSGDYVVEAPIDATFLVSQQIRVAKEPYQRAEPE